MFARYTFCLYLFFRNHRQRLMKRENNKDHLTSSAFFSRLFACRARQRERDPRWYGLSTKQYQIKWWMRIWFTSHTPYKSFFWAIFSTIFSLLFLLASSIFFFSSCMFCIRWLLSDLLMLILMLYSRSYSVWLWSLRSLESHPHTHAYYIFEMKWQADIYLPNDRQ